MEDNFLNDKSNLNPDIGVIKAAVTGSPPILTPEQKQKEIEAWNRKPEAVKNNVKVIDSGKEKSVENWKWGMCIFLAIIGFIVIVAAVGVIGFTIYNDGTLRDVLNFTCAPILNVPASPCTNTCDPVIQLNATCQKDNIYLYCGNQT